MTDKRESILARLVTVCEGVTGIRSARRNSTDISEQHAPYIVVYDGDETADDGDPQGRPRGSVRLVRMTPEIYLVTTGASDGLGTTINGFRASIINAILTDATLAGLTVNGQGIRYDGCSTGLSKGTKPIGQVGLSFSFTYTIGPYSA